MKKKKVLVFGPGSGTKGGITSVIRAHQKTKTWNKWNCRWIETHTTGSYWSKLFIVLKAILLSLVLLPNARIAHIHVSWPMSAKRKMIFFVLSKIVFRNKVVLHLHSDLKEEFYKDYYSLYRFLFEKTDELVVLSNNIGNKVVEHFDINKFKVLYNPSPSFPDNVSSENKKGECPFVLFMGSLKETKGVLDLVEAFISIEEKKPNWELKIAGEGSLRSKINEIINTNCKRDKIELLGWVSGKKKKSVMKSASIFCLPSYTEGFPMVVVEAWSLGIPVITTPVGGLPDILDHKKNALVFEPGDVEKLSENLELLMLNKKLRKRLSKASIKLSNTKFDLKNIDEKLDEIYNHL